MEQQNNIAILRHKKTNRIYRYLGNDEYINLISGQTGKIKPDDAREMFVINMEMTQLIAMNPAIEDLITRLKLVFDK